MEKIIRISVLLLLVVLFKECAIKVPTVPHSNCGKISLYQYLELNEDMPIMMHQFKTDVNELLQKQNISQSEYCYISANAQVVQDSNLISFYYSSNEMSDSMLPKLPSYCKWEEDVILDPNELEYQVLSYVTLIKNPDTLFIAGKYLLTLDTVRKLEAERIFMLADSLICL